MTEQLPPGYQFELDVWGKTSQDSCAVLTSYADALKRSLADQGDWDPEDPSTDIAKVLLAAVKSHLSQQKVPVTKVLLYRTVGTDIDLHGVDGVMQIDVVNITIDTTANREKWKTPADILFRSEHSGRGRIDIVAKAIVKKYLDRRESKNVLEDPFGPDG